MATQPTQELTMEESPSQGGGTSPLHTSSQPEEWGIAVPTDPRLATVPLRQLEVVFGRRDTCDVVLSAATISGRHCKLEYEAEAENLWLEDMSTNGTFLNESKRALNKSRGGRRCIIKSGTKVVLVPRSKRGKAGGGKPVREEVAYIVYLHATTRAGVRGGSGGRAGAGRRVAAGGDGDLEDEESKAVLYDRRHELGRGAFATVYLCVHRRTGMRYALKQIDKKQFVSRHASRRENAIMDEVTILQRLEHPNVIQVHDVWEDAHSVFLVLELVHGGDLFDQIIDMGGPYPDTRARHIFRQLVDAVDYLHRNQVVHRDLKPENILLKDKVPRDADFSDPACPRDVIKISDFGLSRIVGEQSFMKTLCGTPQYLAPEVVAGAVDKVDPAEVEGYSKAVDIWSLGVVLYILLCGHPPFDENGSVPLLEQVRQGLFDFPKHTWRHVKPSAYDLVKRMLQMKPSERITIAEIYNHEWMKGKRGSAVKRKRRLSYESPELKPNGGTIARAAAAAAAAPTPSEPADDTVTQPTKKRARISPPDAPDFDEAMQ